MLTCIKYKSNLHICIFLLTFWFGHLLFIPNTRVASGRKIESTDIDVRIIMCYLRMRLYRISSYCDRSRIVITKWSVIEIYNTYFHSVRDKSQGESDDSQRQQPTIRLFIQCIYHVYCHVQLQYCVTLGYVN